MGKQAPQGPDYQQVAAQQTQANRPNVTTGNASQAWTQGPDGTWKMDTRLADPLQQTESVLQQQAKYGMQQPMDWGQFGQLGTGDAARQQAIDAAYGQATSRLDPQWQQREQQMRSQLANQGLDPTSEAARNAGREFGNARNDAYGSAMNSAIAQGQAAGDAVFRNNLMQRQQMISEALRQRGQPLDELSRLQQFYQLPGYNQTNDMLQGAQLQGESDWRRFIQQQQMDADMAKGGLQLAATLPSLFMLSDERAKTNIVRLMVDALPGVPFAMWTYKPEYGGKRSVGVIAQDLERVAPQYVSTRADGLKVVDYSFLRGDS